MKKTITIIGIILLGLQLQSQNVQVRVLTFDEFEPRLYLEDNYTWVVNFWATWCAPCIKELPYFEKISEEYGDKGVKILLVSLDQAKQLETRVYPFLLKNQIKNEVILLNDPRANRWIDKVDPSWSGALPATLIYGKKYRRFYEKEFSYEELRNALEDALKNTSHQDLF